MKVIKCQKELFPCGMLTLRTVTFQSSSSDQPIFMYQHTHTHILIFPSAVYREKPKNIVLMDCDITEK